MQVDRTIRSRRLVMPDTVNEVVIDGDDRQIRLLEEITESGCHPEQFDQLTELAG